MRSSFHGRQSELREFKQLLRKKQAQLVTCQGRRRIGKSTFIQECGKQTVHFVRISGLPPHPDITAGDQLKNFASALEQQFSTPEIFLKDWPSAFHYLGLLLPQKGSVLLLLDEISWMSQGDKNFSGHLKNAWDQVFKNHPQLILVLCGSVSSWIEANILNSTGFVGRVSWQFRLGPLPLQHCNAFWHPYESRKKRSIPDNEKLQMLSVTGGVPRYLEEIDPTQSAQQNVARLCFHPGGLLFREFDQIFHDIFSRRASRYREIARALVAGPKTLQEISRSLGRESGGSLSQALHDLEGAGFICEDQSFHPLNAKPLARTKRFRLSDNYLRFYLNYVEPRKSQIEKGIYQLKPLPSLEAWPTLVGLQFENLVYNSRLELMEILNLSSSTVLNYGPYFQKATRHQKGCQVDLLIRTNAAAYLIETKVKKKIGPEVIDEVAEKIKRLKLPPKLAVRTALVYQGDLAPSLEEADFFDFLIPFRQLLTFKSA